jgi:predicted MFS family arabinose efflux permease
MLAMVLFGVGEILGCFFIGFIVDKLGSKKAVLFNLAILAAMFSVTFIYIHIYEYGFLSFLMCFLWGF